MLNTYAPEGGELVIAHGVSRGRESAIDTLSPGGA
jgi:hypothetical protein